MKIKYLIFSLCATTRAFTKADCFFFQYSNCCLSISTINCDQMEETLSMEITAALLTADVENGKTTS